MPDQLNRFSFDGTDVRGQQVRLEATWQAALERVDYPEPVRRVLGELMAASLLLTGTLKFEGSLKLEARGEGPLTLAVVQASHDGRVRGLARWEEGLPDSDRLSELMGAKGQFVLTLEPAAENQQRYQGIIGLEDETVAGVLEDYFARSEQLATRLWLAANGERAAGLLLQRMPNRASDDPDAWDRATTLADTLKPEELLGLPAEHLLTRLFHEEQVRVFDPEPVAFRCTCSAEKVGEMLRGLGAEEVRSVLAEQGEVRVNCEFCGRPYVWDTVEVERLFAAGPTPEGPRTHQ